MSVYQGNEGVLYSPWQQHLIHVHYRDHPQSYHTFMWNHLFKHVNIKKENVHILDGNSDDLDNECSKFEADIVKLGGIELFLGGRRCRTHELYSMSLMRTI